MRTASVRWARLAPLTALTTLLGLVALGAAPARALPDSAAPARSAPAGTAADDERVETELTIATLGYDNGVTVRFSYGTTSAEYGMIQDGELGRNGPLIGEREGGFLDTYLAITPRTVPVPYQLLSEPQAGDPLPAELTGRTISSTPVSVTGLAAPPTVMASQDCWDLYWNSFHWYEPADFPDPTTGSHPEKAYYSSSFGGMAMFADSYIGNCGPSGVRHRVYYKSFGEYWKHHDQTIQPWHWQAVHKGSVHRYRKVLYDWGIGYTRNGRFHN